MCLLFIAVKQHPDYPLIIAANRDEYHERPTKSSHWWNDGSDILAGKDLQAGGTWMGVNKKGQFAALTNIRNPQRIKDNAKSRGALVLNALTQKTGLCEDELVSSRDEYNGYNLLHGNLNKLKVFNNFDNTHKTLDSGVYGLSNAALNSPWPKTTKGMRALSSYCQQSQDIEHEALFDILRDNVKAPDHELPVTGAPVDWEKKLSSAFITMPHYGTRASTLLLVSNTGNVTWHERTFLPDAQCEESNSYQFQLEE